MPWNPVKAIADSYLLAFLSYLMFAAHTPPLTPSLLALSWAVPSFVFRVLYLSFKACQCGYFRSDYQVVLVACSVVYPFHSLGFIFVFHALQDLALNRLLSITTVLTRFPEPMSSVTLLASQIHQWELSPQTLQLLLKYLPLFYNSLFQKNEILTVE